MKNYTISLTQLELISLKLAVTEEYHRLKENLWAVSESDHFKRIKKLKEDLEGIILK